MKYPTTKRRSRSWVRRVVRWVWAVIDEVTHPPPPLPSYAELKARAIPHTPRPGARREERQ